MRWWESFSEPGLRHVRRLQIVVCTIAENFTAIKPVCETRKLE